ncbi:MAG: hypothetical protein V2I67_02155 [Thermoanaerobaculales bacterium]|nr:hypothetical protein [Thermoanaerobaculales bacterium]
MKPPPVRTLVGWGLTSLTLLAAAAIVAALGIHAWGVHRLDTAQAVFDSRWGELVDPPIPSQVPDHLNGARWLVAGGQAVICTMEDYKFYGVLADRPARSWSDTELAHARRILHEQRAALDILLRSASFDAYHFGNGGLRPRHHEIDFLSIIRGLRLLVLHARLAWYDGRPMQCLEALEVVGRAADGLMRTPVVMASTLGSGSVRWVVWAAADVVADPCATMAVLDRLRAGLPSVDPVHANDITMACSVAEIARDGLGYVEDFHDPSMGWSLPFWISNHFLFEDLFVAEILNRWGRYLELCRQPAARWPPNPSSEIWGDPAWPPWLALAGTITPNLFAGRARAQTAATELQQLRLALDLRSSSPTGLDRGICGRVEASQSTPLTGEPVVCRFDDERQVIVIDVPQGTETLIGHATLDNRSEHLFPIELVIGPTRELCR